jgi:hypothetical protein
MPVDPPSATRRLRLTKRPRTKLCRNSRIRYASTVHLAQAVVDAGVVGVVAMRYNVYVATAAQFVGELYQVMAEGYSLGRAVTRARKHLGDMPDRAVVGAPIPL